MRIILKKFIYRFVIPAFAGAVLIVFGFVIYLEGAIDTVLCEDQKQMLYKEVRSTHLPDNFYATIEKYVPDYFEVTFLDELANKAVGNHDVQCECSKGEYHWATIGNCGEVEGHPRFWRQIMILDLEENVTQKECLAYNMINAYYGVRGVEQAAIHYYDANLEDLTERQIMELFVMRDGFARYNPYTRRKYLDARVNKLMQEKH